MSAAANQVNGVEFTSASDGRVVWSSNWTEIYRIAATDQRFREVWYPGTYGHTSLFFNA